MNDLHIIAKQNAKATEAAVPREVAAGKHVVVEYLGLSFIGHRSFDNADAAKAYSAKEIAARGSIGYRTQLHHPEQVAA